MPMTVRVGGAPISWGVCEIPNWGPQLPVDRVLDELQTAGYAGTELGPWGFLPTDAAVVGPALARRGLAMAAAFVPLQLKDPAAYEATESQMRETAMLLRALGSQHIVLADAGDEHRRQIAGRPALTASGGLTAREWTGYAARLEQLSQICRFDYGLVPCFHPHGGTYIEHPDEISALLNRTDQHLVKLCLDTGHIAFGSGDPVALAKRYAGRIGHVHLKDIDQPRLRTLLEAGSDYVGAAQAGVFVELGAGSLDIPGLLAVLEAAAFDGWIIVEQDRVVGTDTDTAESARRNREFLRQRAGL
jgi:inosose dehydratase